MFSINKFVPKASSREILDEFYFDLFEWLNGGRQFDLTFSDGMAICASLNDWLTRNNYDDPLWRVELKAQLKWEFTQTGRHEDFPFNNGNQTEFTGELIFGTFWENKERINWVYARVMSDRLQFFYEEIRRWYEGGCQNNRQTAFSEWYGLCTNLIAWATISKNLPIDTVNKLKQELESQFKKAELDPRYPFNNGNFLQYDSEVKWLNNSMRIQWLKDHSIYWKTEEIDQVTGY